MSKFVRVKKTTLEKSYIVEFEDLSNRVRGFYVEFKVEAFIAGLKDDILNEVAPFKPRMMIEAKNMVFLQEGKHANQHRAKPFNRL